MDQPDSATASDDASVPSTSTGQHPVDVNPAGRFAFDDSERQAQEWLDRADRGVGVGRRHHTVPAFYLRRFADKSGQLSVRDRTSGALSRRGHLDMGIRDFYTIVSKDGTLDGRLEQMLSVVERNANRIFTDLLSPFRRPRPLDPADHSGLAAFIAFQIVRGERQRRELELMADYTAKVQAGNRLTSHDLDSLTATPHPNDHLKMMARTAETIATHLENRPLTLIDLDQPLLVTGDEPVIVNVGDDHVKHKPDCFVTKKELARRRRAGERNGKQWSQIVHIYPTRPSGVAGALEVALPLSPRSVLFLGPQGAHAESRTQVLSSEAESLAEALNRHVIAQSLSWVAAHPEHPSFASLPLPPPGPLIAACDGGSIMSDQLKNAPRGAPTKVG